MGGRRLLYGDINEGIVIMVHRVAASTVPWFLGWRRRRSVLEHQEYESHLPATNTISNATHPTGSSTKSNAGASYLGSTFGLDNVLIKLILGRIGNLTSGMLVWPGF